MEDMEIIKIYLDGFTESFKNDFIIYLFNLIEMKQNGKFTINEFKNLIFDCIMKMD